MDNGFACVHLVCDDVPDFATNLHSGRAGTPWRKTCVAYGDGVLAIDRWDMRSVTRVTYLPSVLSCWVLAAIDAVVVLFLSLSTAHTDPTATSLSLTGAALSLAVRPAAPRSIAERLFG